MQNRKNRPPIEKANKEGTAQEFILLCCALLFLCNVFSSHFLEDAGNSPELTLQVGPGDTLALLADSDQKPELEEVPAGLTPFFFEPIPINYCDKELLMSVSGIGPALADSILATRERVGLFKNKDDLLQVPGIGKSRMSRFASAFDFSTK